MEENKIKIAIICRANPKWNYLHEILDENNDELVYNIYDVANPKWETKYKEHNIEYNAYIYLATMPKFTNKPYTHLKASATEADIENAISRLFEELNGDNNGTNVESTDAGAIDDKHSGDIAGASICSSDSNDIIGDTKFSDSVDRSSNNDGIRPLIGIVIKICNKEVVLNKDDACKLKELIEFSKENNYEIIDVITGNESSNE